MKMTTNQKIKKLREKINKLEKEEKERIILSILQEDENYSIIKKYFDYKENGLFTANFYRGVETFYLKVHYRYKKYGTPGELSEKGFAYDGGYKFAPTFSEWLSHMKDEQTWIIKQSEYQIKQAKKCIEFIETISNDIIQKKSEE